MQIEARESGRPAKRQKMQRAVSLNTILQTVGCQEEDSLKDAAGTAPLTVEDIVASPKKATTQVSIVKQIPSSSNLAR